VKPEAMARANASIQQAVRMLHGSGTGLDALIAAAGVDGLWPDLSEDDVLKVARAAEEITTNRAELAEENGNWYLTVPARQQRGLFSEEARGGPGSTEGRDIRGPGGARPAPPGADVEGGSPEGGTDAESEDRG
jgi:hypothetical protein